MDNIKIEGLETMNLPQIREAVQELADKWNECGEFAEYKKMKEIHKAIDEGIAEYSKKAEAECFVELGKADNVLHAAAVQLVFPTIKARTVENPETHADEMVIENSVKRIDPLKLNKRSQEGYGFDKRWPAMVERLNFAMTIRRALELEVKPEQIKEIRDCYAMSKIAHEYEEFKTSGGNGKNPTSVAVLVEDVQKIVDAMIGEGFTVTKADINYLLAIYSKKNNRQSLSVTCANHKFMRQYILEIAHRAITGEQYSVEYKKVKNAG